MKIYQKLANVQNGLKVEKEGKNPHFKSEYFLLEDILLALRPLLEKAKLCLYQKIVDDKLLTVLIDLDEQVSQIESSMILPLNLDPQKMGSAISYFKRYSLTSLFLIEERDDDANAAVGRDQKNKVEVKKPEQEKKPVNPPQKPKNEAPISMDEARMVYEKAQTNRRYSKSDVDALLIKRYGVDSATKLKKHEFESIMKNLEKV
jgi:hypothetical protein